MAALPEEAGGLFRRLDVRGDHPTGATSGATRGGTRPSVESLPLKRFEVGRLAGRRVAVAVTGDGPGNAGRGARAVLEALPVERLLVVGVSGALGPELGVGRLLVAREVVGPDGERWPADEEAVDAAARAAGAAPAVLLTSRELATTPEARRRLRRRAGGSDHDPPDAERRPGGGRREPDAVDLESAAYVAAARDAGLPWAVLRAVSDAVHETLPSYLETCRDEDGALRRLAVAVNAAMRPWSVPGLVRLGRRVRRLADPLAEATERLVAAWVPASPPSSAPNVDASGTHVERLSLRGQP